MHKIQEKLLNLIDEQDVSILTLRDIASKIGETGSPQKIKHHLNQLAKKGLIRIDKNNGKIEKVKSGLNADSHFISLPILGSANCGQAACFAENHVEGYLKVTKGVLGELAKRADDLFVLRAAGSSMNKTNIGDNNIEDGDFVIIDRTKTVPFDGACVVSIIDGVANIKKIYKDDKNEQFILVSESNQDLPPIYIHQSDMENYSIAGVVVKVMKQPDELAAWRNAAGEDALKGLGDISKEEYDYYENLCLKNNK